MRKPHVVIIGSGFGGLFAAKALRRADVEITLIARTTHHLFQPLLYQVATGILSEGEIAPATREVLRRQRNVKVQLGLVEHIDVGSRQVHWRFHNQEHVTDYDFLIVAAGAGQSYFGNDRFARFAPGMKSIDDALELRARIFGAFELAENEPEGTDVSRLLTFAVVGAGPTGVEMAGQIRELASQTLVGEFRRIDPRKARVVLIEGGPRVLPSFGEDLGDVARRSLTKRGVEVWTDTLVTEVDDQGLEVRRGDGSTERLESVCKVWAAGVAGNPLGRQLAEQTGAELDRAGRVRVQPDLSLPGHGEVFVVGDLAAVDGVPGVAQGAIQGARYVAGLIRGQVAGQRPQAPFSYKDKGSMATISRFSAVVSAGKVKLTGFVAWVAWLVLHLLYIAGFKQRLSTLLHWFISFLTRGRSERVTTNQQMVARLALEELGERSSGRLMVGSTDQPKP
ncbi:MAG: NAD(P)/FAD-dependent oxidoreductase [Propionibacteriaceae bacterium]|nr:NAD(P)/FAD-dependent oxidoreductase [Propionibacteriaceae bacterium]